MYGTDHETPILSPLEMRPRKRSKHTASVHATIMLNEQGVLAFQSKNFTDAERYFSQALCRVDVGFLCNAIQSSLDSCLPRYDSDDEPLMLRNKKDKKSILKDTEEKDSGRFDYDEGMFNFNCPLGVDESSSPESMLHALLYNLGLIKIKQNKYLMAKDFFLKALTSLTPFAKVDIREIQSMHNVALCLYRLGNNAEALVFYDQALEISMKLDMCFRSRYQAAAYNCLAVLHFHGNHNDTKKVLEYLTKSLDLYQECLGMETAEVGTVLNNIGRAYYLQGDYEKALQVYGKALKIRKRVLGHDNIEVAATVYNFGQACQQLGNSKKALACYEEFLQLTTKQLGENSRDVAIAYRCMGELHHGQGKLDKALEMFKKALTAARASLGYAHADIASCLNKLGHLCYEMKDDAGALRYYQDGLQVEQRILQCSHPHIIITLTNMAHIYKNQGEYSLALSAYRQVYAKQVVNFGNSSIECATTLSSIGLMQYTLKLYSEAFESYQEALRIRRDTYGTDDHTDIASNLNSIGLVLFKQNMLDMSQHCFTESLRIRLKLLGRDHRDVAILWYNIATIYFEQGQEDIAIRLYEETLRVERVALGHDHSDVALTLQHVGQVLQHIGKLDKALDYFKEALRVEKSRQDVNHLSVAKILNLIGNIHLQRCNISDMMECFVEASRIYQGRRQQGETLVIAGYSFYALTKLNPECAPVA